MDDKWKGSKKDCSSSSGNKHPHLLRSCSVSSQKTNVNSSSSSSSKSPLLRSFSQKGNSLSRKCTNLAKEQKARFYIARRCVAMLACWHKHGDS